MEHFQKFTQIFMPSCVALSHELESHCMVIFVVIHRHRPKINNSSQAEESVTARRLVFRQVNFALDPPTSLAFVVAEIETDRETIITGTCGKVH